MMDRDVRVVTFKGLKQMAVAAFGTTDNQNREHLRLREAYVQFPKKTEGTFREEEGEFKYCLYPEIENRHSEWIDGIKI